MSATERMIAYHLARLKDKNPDVRIKSIEELALLEATDAFPVLEDLFRSDPDSNVRLAAQKAGRVLYVLIHKSKDDKSENGNPPKAGS
jgi:hypothetical protein